MQYFFNLVNNIQEMVSFDHHLITYAYPVPLIDTPKKQNKILMIRLVTDWVYLKSDFRVVPRIP